MQVLQSNKWTFSLASLIVLLALGFALMPVMAHKAEKGDSHLKVDFRLDSSVIDVSSESTATTGIEEDVQVDSGRVRGSFSYPRPIVARPGTRPGGTDVEELPFLTFLVEFDKQVPLTFFRPDTTVTAHPFGSFTNAEIGFGLDDIAISAFDEFGKQRGSVTLEQIAAFASIGADAFGAVKAARDSIAQLVFTNPGGTTIIAPGELAGRQFTLEVYLDAVTAITEMFSGIEHSLISQDQGGDFEITNLIFSFTSRTGTDHSVTEAVTLEYLALSTGSW